MNKFRKNTITLILLGIFTFSSIGFTITSLCCDHSEFEQISKLSDSCCTEIEEISCCEEEPAETHNCDNGCDGACFSTEEYSKLEVDQIASEKIGYEAILYSSEIILDNIESEFDEILSNTNPDKSPPNASGRALIYSLNKPKIPYLIIV